MVTEGGEVSQGTGEGQEGGATHSDGRPRAVWFGLLAITTPDED